MRAWIVAVALVAACKGKQQAKPHADKPATAPVAEAAALPTVPAVTVATVLAKDDARPPLLMIVDDAGKARLAAAASWADLDAGKVKITKRPVRLLTVADYVVEQAGFERAPSDSFAEWDELTSDPDYVDLDLHTIHDQPPAEPDDPPPPEEEDSPDTGEDEAPRAEGQYKMKGPSPDPELARRAAADQARADRLAAIPSAPYANPAHPAHADGTPSRVAQIGGAIYDDSTLDRVPALILVAPTAKATQLIDAVAASQGAITVALQGKLRPLRVQFRVHDASEPPAWLEARVTAKGLALEAVPDAPIEVAALDAPQLTAALDKARTAHAVPASAPVDVLVDPDVDAQHLVDVLVALDVAGVRSLGLGAAPTGDELARRGHPATK